MNIAGLKARLKKLEPKIKGNNFFGSIHINDPHIFHTADHHFLGMWRIYGYIQNVCANFEGGYFDTLEEGLQLLKKALRRHTEKPCSIFLMETKNNERYLHTIYSYEDKRLIDKHPQGLSELPPGMLSGEKETTKWTDLEWVGFYDPTL